jgi:GNAT superfamily N-acetyltransferase
MPTKVDRHPVLLEIDASAQSKALGLSYDITIRGGHTIEINRLDVDSEYRWNGTASRFLDRLTHVADSHGLPIELEVGSGTDDENIVNDLPRFYAKWGFEFQDGYMRRAAMDHATDVRLNETTQQPRGNSGPSI